MKPNVLRAIRLEEDLDRITAAVSCGGIIMLLIELQRFIILTLVSGTLFSWITLIHASIVSVSLTYAQKGERGGSTGN